MSETVQVTTVAGDREVIAGRLFINRGTGVFHYDAAYLANPAAYALAPSLPLVAGAQPLDGLGGLSDSAPDRWGRKLLQRARKRTSLSEFDYLMGVDDAGRQGSLRYWINDTPLSSDGTGIPHELDLPELLTTADAIELDPSAVDDIQARRLFRATGSLGGARPKANVLINGELWLAKFPKPVGDEWDLMGWEYTLNRLSADLGIIVPQARLLKITDINGEDRHIYVARRFDRLQDSRQRIPYISAMTALEASDGDGGDWVDVVEYAREEGADTEQLWKRAMLGVLVGNTDDHLRNHGFLRFGREWEIAPCFDMNPTPDGDAHQVALFGDPSYESSALVSKDSLSLFGVSEQDAHGWLRTAAPLLERVSERARGYGVDAPSASVMRPRFERATQTARELSS